MKQPIARDIMSKPVMRLSARVSVRQAAEFLLKHGISGALVVEEHGRPAGVFSQRDIAAYIQKRLATLPEIDPWKERVRGTGERLPLRRGFQFQALDETPVSEVMTPGVITTDPVTPIGSLARLMNLYGVHRVFVEADQEIQGVVTSMDLLKWVDRALPARKTKARTRVGR